MNRNLNEAIFDIAKVEAIMFAFENTYLELDVAPADRARADMATDAFYALRDAIRKVSDDLDRLAGDCRGRGMPCTSFAVAINTPSTMFGGALAP